MLYYRTGTQNGVLITEVSHFRGHSVQHSTTQGHRIVSLLQRYPISVDTQYNTALHRDTE